MPVVARDYTGWILMLIAVGLGLAAFFLIRQYLGSEGERLREEARKSRGDMAQVVVASGSLEAGAVIGKATMSVGEIPRRHLSARAVRPGDFSQVENRVLSRPMSAGEPLLADFVSGMVVNRFSDLLADGTRAVSLEVSAMETHSGLLIPGDYIDLFAQVPKSPGSRETRLVGLYERVKVLAAGRNPLRSAEQSFQPLPEQGATYSLITVSLPVEDAEKVLRAKQLGEVVYLLRGADDDARTFADRGTLQFDEHEQKPPGYAYYSAAVPRGERRPIGKSAEPEADDAWLATRPEDQAPFDPTQDPEYEATLRRQIMMPARPREDDLQAAAADPNG